VQGPKRSRRTVSLGVCPTKSLARERPRGFIERAGINSNCVLYARTAPGTKFEQQAEWWIEGLTTRRRRPPKTASAVRLVDIAEPLAQVLCQYTSGLDGHLFTNLNGGRLDQRNVFDALHIVGKRGGFHVFRRFRFALLRKEGIPEHLIKLWLGHPQDLTDRYAAQLNEDVAYRREGRERAGLGFELGELGYKGLFAIRPSLFAQTCRLTGFRIGCGGWI
jgi:hypothetical protein